MVTLEQAELVFAAAKSLRDNVKKRERMSANSPDFREVSQHRFNKHNTDMTWLGMHIDKTEFTLHTEIVRAGICRPYEDSYYTDTVHRPSAFHEYEFKRPHPLKSNRDG